MDDDEPPQLVRPNKQIGPIARAAIVLGVLGIAWGTIYALLQLDGLLALVSVTPYAHPMLGAIVPGAIAIVLGLIDLVQRRRWLHFGIVVVVGAGAIVAPFIAALVIGVLILLTIFALVTG